jgi:hypothetical protein
MPVQLRLAAAAAGELLLLVMVGVSCQKQLQSCRGDRESCTWLLRDRFELQVPSTAMWEIPHSGGEDASSQLAGSSACGNMHVNVNLSRIQYSPSICGSRHDSGQLPKPAQNVDQSNSGVSTRPNHYLTFYNFKRMTVKLR